ncbi:MAG TPA: TlpA disulfide reductase family protein [Ktedonobacterales bacterium]|jgi:peroxiredoxin
MVETKRMITYVRTFSIPTRLKVGIIAVALVAILVAVGIRVSMPNDSSSRALVGKSAPDFALAVATAPTAAPQTVSLAAQRGHPVLLVFFFTLCTHCQPQLRTVHSVAAPYAERGLDTYAINSPAESYDVLASYSARLGFDPVILRDSRATVADAYGVQLYPTTVLIDGQGVVRAVWTGETDAATLDQALRQVVTP